MNKYFYYILLLRIKYCHLFEPNFEGKLLFHVHDERNNPPFVFFSYNFMMVCLFFIKIRSSMLLLIHNDPLLLIYIYPYVYFDLLSWLRSNNLKSP